MIISFRGKERCTDELVFHSRAKNFRSGQTDTFVEHLPALGPLESATVQLSHKGKQWLLHEVCRLLARLELLQ